MPALASTGHAVQEIEPLEPRLFLSTTPVAERFNLMSLFGYDRLGASYKYRSTVTHQDEEGTQTASVTTKLGVSTRRKTYDGHASNLVTQSAVNGASSVTAAWYQDSTGTYVTARAQVGTGIDVSSQLHDTRIAPKYLYVGKKYEDSGTFDGTFKGDLLDQVISGSFKGTSTASAKIFGRETITVRGVTYANAIKGVFAISLNGKMTATVNGETGSAPAKLTATETFWAAPGIGVVRTQEQIAIHIVPPDEGPVDITVTGRSDLVSYVLP